MYESFTQHVAALVGSRQDFQDQTTATMMSQMTSGQMFLFVLYTVVLLVISLAIFSYLWNNALVPSMSILKRVTLVRSFGIMLFFLFYVCRS